MRVLFPLFAGVLVLTWAAGTSWSAGPQTSPGTSVSPPPATVIQLDRATKPTGVRQSLPVAGFSALTSDECTNLGGTVKDDIYGVCASKKSCATVDNFGNKHSVCLSVATQ